MEEVIAQVTTILRRMWTFRWPSLAAAWIVGLVGAIVSFAIPNQYEATARIYVDTQSILKPLMSGLTVQPNVEQQVGMLSRTLISRPNIEKLVRMADLDLKSSTKGEQDALVDKLMRSIEIRSTARDNLYSLAYRESDKDKAKRVIQSMVSIFVESSLGASRKDTDSAKVFLNEQIKSYEAKLEEAETRLKEFRLRNLDMQAADGKDGASRLVEISGHLEQAKLELREAEQARDAAKQQLAADQGQVAGSELPNLLPEAAANFSTPEIDGRIDAQKRNLDALLQRYTDQHPDVVGARKLIKELEDQKKEQVAELRRAAAAAPKPVAPGGAGINRSLAHQELSRVLATSEIQVASLRARVAEYQSRYGQARTMMKSSPQLEAEAAQLNRDYAINKKNYEDLVARRQSAVMSGELDVASGVADFRLIDPPRVSPHPVFPNRLLLLGAALVVGLAAGVLTAFAGTQLRPVFDAASELRAKTGLPLLGVVSMIVSDDNARRERIDRLRFVAGSGGLVILFAIGLVATALWASRQVG
ncbi:XrtA system polysaccharide chain length determinant [Ideonella sp. A 288]|uniref:XrtA system polysaccharide chain length determinant n=1 Tax=Ideonella sp. A 288 TaxID=1962181 RepID=UPI000B4AB5DF|nr:XrtA system polysaccharide chain length determinant [Ideonella sp. A 288]